MRVLIYQQSNERSRHICEAFLNGVRAAGDDASITKMEPGKSAPVADVAIFYGQSEGGRELLNSYVKAGKHVLYIDMGYWNRKTKQDMYGGYHKIALNDLHPTARQLDAPCSDDRFKEQGIKVIGGQPPRGDHVLLAGLSEKAALVNGLQPYEWENKTIELIRQYTDRPIVFRPKPSWKGAKPIPGTIFSGKNQPLNDVLLNAHCVVTRHSNVAIDALVEAIPAFTQLGASRGFCGSFDELRYIDVIESPPYRARYDFLSSLAYCQWNLEEMRSGEAWRWYKELM